MSGVSETSVPTPVRPCAGTAQSTSMRKRPPWPAPTVQTRVLSSALPPIVALTSDVVSFVFTSTRCVPWVDGV